MSEQARLDLQRRQRLRVARLFEQGYHARRDIQAPRFQHHVHHGQTAHEIIGRLFGRAPHSRMGGQSAVKTA